MSYSLSQIDKNNIQWFSADKTRSSLVKIQITNGNIRGIYPCEVEFAYPVTAFVGENGSGKSTILALAACAFHNTDSFHQFPRKKSYFTFGDFFTFSPDEQGVQGIEINYTIRQEDGDKNNIRRKKPSGKWNDYNTRKIRNVVYLGINRIVPPSESSAHRSYRKLFETEEIDAAILSQIKTLASRIFGRNYNELRIFVHNAYRLFLVKRNELLYSGFNMGAGENAVISILLELLSAGMGSLMVIDEIELGLHAKAQHEFIRVLKEICLSNKCQIICSTHSDIILNELPPEGRFFIENQTSHTLITPGISAEYAFGKLAEQNSGELDIFVEDIVGKTTIENIIPKNIRERIKLFVIGSDQAILKQIAARYRESKNNFIAFLDGDKRRNHQQQVDQIKRHLESRLENEEQFDIMMEQRLHYIIGDAWPELSIIKSLLDSDMIGELTIRWGATNDEEVKQFLEQALAAGKHKEFYTLSQRLSLDEVTVRVDCAQHLKRVCPEECTAICEQIEQLLNAK